MVVCGRIDGKPCRCDLDDLRIHRDIIKFISLVLKLLFRTISNRERLELHDLSRNATFRTYLCFYIEELDKFLDKY